MAYFDLPLEELQNYLPVSSAAPDFDRFWQATLREAQGFDLAARFEPVDQPLRLVQAFDATFSGYGGQPVKGWLILPRQATQSSARLPCVVEYIGYGGGRGFPADWLLWANAGYAHFVMDTRGQGSSWRQGDTPDSEPEGSNPHYPGFMTRGVLNPHTYYYRRVYTDAVRAVEAARCHPAVDPERIALTGASQGGGITLAASALASNVRAAMPDVPFLCHFRRATQVTDKLPYQEIVAYCKAHREKVAQVFSTLSYFDGMNFAQRAKAPALFSVGLMDETCPPSTVYAAYNHYNGPKQIRIWEFNNHEGGGSYQSLEKVEFLNQLFGMLDDG